MGHAAPQSGMGHQVSALLRLREYQSEAIEAIETDWAAGVRRPAVVLPTGAGKTVIFAHLSARWRAANRSRVMVLVHRDELINQAVDKLHAIAPHLTIGVIKGPRHEVNRDVIVASVQSLRNDTRRHRVHEIGLIIVDECHHAVARTYREILAHFGCMSPNGYAITDGATRESALAVGFTATMTRADDESLGEIWQKVSYRKDIRWFMRRGFLLDVYGKRVEVDDLDLSGVKRSHGDYQDGDLGKAMMESLAPELTAKAYVENAPERAGVGFAPTVAAAGMFCEAFNDLGIKSELVSGTTPLADRREIFGRAHSGVTQTVWNCGVATEGTDVPIWSCAVIARPTSSAGLYVQMVGRVLRPHVGQGAGQPIEKALVLDVAGATRRHKLASLVDLTGRTYREEIEPDESLLDHDDREDEYEAALDLFGPAGQAPDLSWEFATGPTRTVEVDLFEQSRQHWLTTSGGIYFLQAGEQRYVFLAPAATPGLFDVAWAWSRKKGGGFTEHRDVPLEYAMAWGEDAAAEMDPDGTATLSGKGRSWRDRKASDKAKNYARSLGIQFEDSIRGGDLGNLITIKTGSSRIDPIMTAILRQRGA
jgi:superfamily II DNA or RNA helicase